MNPLEKKYTDYEDSARQMLAYGDKHYGSVVHALYYSLFIRLISIYKNQFHIEPKDLKDFATDKQKEYIDDNDLSQMSYHKFVLNHFLSELKNDRDFKLISGSIPGLRKNINFLRVKRNRHDYYLDLTTQKIATDSLTKFEESKKTLDKICKKLKIKY